MVCFACHGVKGGGFSGFGAAKIGNGKPSWLNVELISAFSSFTMNVGVAFLSSLLKFLGLNGVFCCFSC